MFAIFSALYDSIQASRLILRAPTVSPSIRNMYNSTACISPFFFYKHTLKLLPALSDEANKQKKRIVCLENRAWGWGCCCLGIGADFYFPQLPECEHKSHVLLHAETLTDCLMVGHCQLSNHQPQSCPAIVNLSFLMATVGQMLTEQAGQLNTRALYLSLVGKPLLCCSVYVALCEWQWCALYPLGGTTDCVQYKWCFFVQLCVRMHE